MDGDYFNFNSLYPAPEALSAFYLTAYLDSLKEQGYTIFVIRGQLPASPAATGTQEMDGPGKWWSPDEVGGVRDEGVQGCSCQLPQCHDGWPLLPLQPPSHHIRGPLPASPAVTGAREMDGPGRVVVTNRYAPSSHSAPLHHDDPGSSLSLPPSQNATSSFPKCNIPCSAAPRTRLLRLLPSWAPATPSKAPSCTSSILPC